MRLETFTDWARAMTIRLDEFLSNNPLEDPALLALAFCYNPFSDFTWQGMLPFMS